MASERNWMLALISAALGIIAFILILKVDWEKYFEKYVAGDES